MGLGGRLRVHEVIGIDYASCIPSKLISADQILAVKELEENSEVSHSCYLLNCLFLERCSGIVYEHEIKRNHNFPLGST